MIDERAVVDPGARIGADVTIGAFSIIEADVEIGDGTTIGPHVVVRRGTRIGRRNHIFQFASVGEAPQDKKYAGEPTRLEIGDDNQVREFTTLHRGTVQDGGLTRIGDRNLLMAYTHVAHDCMIGNDAILANAASLGGHVHVGDWAILGGFSIVHQFCRVGAHSFLQMGSVITRDIPPYLMIGGQPAKPHGINQEGLKRRGFETAELVELRRAYKKLYMAGLKLQEARAELELTAADCPVLRPLVEFLSVDGRSIIR